MYFSDTVFFYFIFKPSAPPPPSKKNLNADEVQSLNVCINFLVMCSVWKEGVAQLYGSLDGAYFDIEFISKFSRVA